MVECQRERRDPDPLCFLSSSLSKPRTRRSQTQRKRRLTPRRSLFEDRKDECRSRQRRSRLLPFIFLARSLSLSTVIALRSQPCPRSFGHHLSREGSTKAGAHPSLPLSFTSSLQRTPAQRNEDLRIHSLRKLDGLPNQNGPGVREIKSAPRRDDR